MNLKPILEQAESALEQLADGDFSERQGRYRTLMDLLKRLAKINEATIASGYANEKLLKCGLEARQIADANYGEYVHDRYGYASTELQSFANHLAERGVR